jgi:hypothetical protein
VQHTNANLLGGATTLSTMTFGIMTLSINNAQHHNTLPIMPSVAF